VENLFTNEALKELGFGGAIGFLVGFTFKRIFKLMAFILGLYLISLIWLADNGVITVNWAALEGFARGFFSSFSSFAQNIVRTASFGGGFAVGFAIGMKV